MIHFYFNFILHVFLEFKICFKFSFSSILAYCILIYFNVILKDGFALVLLLRCVTFYQATEGVMLEQTHAKISSSDHATTSWGLYQGFK